MRQMELFEEMEISIHAPREGCDQRGASPRPPREGISIHAPREGCDLIAPRFVSFQAISIHAPREGCDELWQLNNLSIGISIHAPREGCDWQPQSLALFTLYFNPRTPRGVRQVPSYNDWPNHEFQSTHPARGATGSLSR